MKKSTKVIGNEYDCCRTTICRILRRYGINVTKSRAQAEVSEKEIVFIYKNKHTFAEIAAHFGVSLQIINRYLRDGSVPICRRWDYW